MIVPCTSITGTPCWPDFLTISCAALVLVPTLIDVKAILFVRKNSFAFMHQGQASVEYTSTFDLGVRFLEGMTSVVEPFL